MMAVIARGMRAVMILMAMGSMPAAPANQAGQADASLVYIATRATSQAAAGPQGIYAAHLDAQSGKLSPLGLQVEMPGTSWLVTHPSRPLLYLVANPDGNPRVESKVFAYAADQRSGALTQLGAGGTGGQDTTHLTLDARSHTLVGASFTTGQVSAIRIQPDGTYAGVTSVQQDHGTGPHPRQSAPHAHAVVVDPTRRFVIAADMGADRVFVYRFDPSQGTLAPAATPYEGTPPGSGPRHLVFDPTGRFLFINTELSAEVRSYRWNARDGRLQLVQAVSAYPDGYTGTAKSSAEIGVLPNGRALYVSLRGDQHSLVVYKVNARSGRLTEIQRLPSQGKSPRSFAIDPTGRWLLVANDGSNTVNVFSIEPGTGKLAPTHESIPVPNAAALAFVGGNTP
jgi:6-phosphogluconolactonase